MKLNRDTAAVNPNHPVKVIQFGGGNFLRGFADWMIDVMNEKSGFKGSVQIVLSVNKEVAKTMEEQQGLYHVIINGLVHGKPFQEIRLISSIAGTLDPVDQYEMFLKAAENPDLEFIISNTTEAGIVFQEGDTGVDKVPLTFPGKLTALLFHRFDHFKKDQPKKLIVLPCELIQSNGERLREIIFQYADHWKLPIAFKEWISSSIVFCNTLVDRIVPGFPKENYQQLQEQTGYEDKLMTMAEPFHFWAIQPCSGNENDLAYVKNHFPTHAARLDVKFVNDLAPYHTRKVRILNGAHTALTPVAYLNGLRFVKESVENLSIGNFIRQAIFAEILPGLAGDEKELDKFAQDVLERFKNPYIKHELGSIALNSISKFKVRVLSSILRYYEMNDRLPVNLMFAWAALICFYKGEWRGKQIPLNDAPDVIHFFKEAWKLDTVNEVASKVLSNQILWGYDFTSIKNIQETMSSYLSEILSLDNPESETTSLVKKVTSSRLYGSTIL